MSKEREYQELYDRLRDEVSTLHENNRRRIRIGMRMLLAVTLGLMLLMFLAEGNKVFTLMLWILSMFAVAAYLIAVEYADYELQKKLEDITQMEQESMGALLELPELPRMPRLPALRHRGQREEAPAWEREEPETAAAETESVPEEPEAESMPEEPVVYTVDDILQELHSQPAETAYVPKRMQEPERVSAPEPEKQVAPVSGSGAAVWQKMLDDPEKLAGDLEKLTQALQGLSADLRRSAEESRKEDDR